MNYAEATAYLYGLGHEMRAMKLGLESMRALARTCGDPQRRFPAVHIAGTNGKGSTAAMTEAILRAAGWQVGLYTSPHLVEVTERIRVDGRGIAPAEFARLATEVRARCERLVSDGELPAPPTFFEQVTMIAFLHFATPEVELVVLEVGLGGRLDATNICEPLVTAITPVSVDHQQYLGEQLAAIAGEKAGIIKLGIPVVVAPQENSAMEVIAARSRNLDAPLVPVCAEPDEPSVAGADGCYRFRRRTMRAEYDVSLNLRGRHQIGNALTAIGIADQLSASGLALPPAAVTAGLGRVDWPGRLELVAGVPALLLDGAHNPAGARVLRDFLDEHCSGRPITLIFGAMSDKAIVEISTILFPVAATVIATRIANPRSADPAEIAALAGAGQPRLVAEDSTRALAEARRLTPPDGLICACGSLYLVGELRRALRL